MTVAACLAACLTGAILVGVPTPRRTASTASACRDRIHRIHVGRGSVAVCGRVADVRFADRDHGWVLAIGNCATDLGVRVYATSDDGMSWRAFATRLTVNCAAGSGAYMRLRGVGDLTVVATSANACFSAAVRTLDEGLRWYSFSLPACGGDLAFASPVRGWYAGALSSQETPLYETRDGGRSWRVRPLPRPEGYRALGACLVEAPRFGRARAALPAFVRSTSGYARAVYRTVDAGRHWTVTVVGPRRADSRTAGPVPWVPGDGGGSSCPAAEISR